MDRRRRPTAFDVAALAGVSQPTVSRALRRMGGISDATRDRVIAAARELGYAVDINASRLKSTSANALALVIICRPGESRATINPFYYSLLGGIAAAAAERGFDLLVSFQDGGAALLPDYEASKSADAVIVIGTTANPAMWAHVRHLHGLGRRLVCWGAPDEDLPWVRSDNHEGGRLAVERLVADGAQRIVFVGSGPSPQRQFAERQQGYERALAAHGLSPILMPVDLSLAREEQGRDAVARLIASGTVFDGLFAACDMIGLGVLQALKEHGLTSPGDVRVVGFDGIRSGRFASPSLTTIEPDFEVAGQALVDSVIATIRGEPVAPARVPVRLLPRESA